MTIARKIIPYNSKLKLLARDLRKTSTKGEIILWKKLKGKQFFGYDFHRQKPLLEYIVDFYCPQLNLVIEIDGKYHNSEEVYYKDLNRQKELEKYDFHFIRFTEKDIRFQLINVLRALEIYIGEFEKHNLEIFQKEKHTPDPSQEGKAE